MLLTHRSSGHMIEVLNLVDLMNPMCEQVAGRSQEGEEAQDPVMYRKSGLMFLSGEDLPRCWTDAHYRDDELAR